MFRRCHVIALAALALAILIPATARAMSPTIGANFGFGYYLPEEGDGTLDISWPGNTSFIFPIFEPGLRVGFADETGRHLVYLDTGFAFLSSDGSVVHSFQGSLNYQHHFSTSAISPFLTGGAGIYHVGDDDESFSSVVFGGGIGVRQTLGHGHGAFRVEVRADRMSGFDGGWFANLDPATVVALKFGFDLYGR